MEASSKLAEPVEKYTESYKLGAEGYNYEVVRRYIFEYRIYR